LKTELQLGAVAHGYEEEYWTCKRIADLVEEMFGKSYSESGTWKIMQRMKWSSQKPQRRSLSRNDEAVAEWLNVTWPDIKKATRTWSHVGVSG